MGESGNVTKVTSGLDRVNRCDVRLKSADTNMFKGKKTHVPAEITRTLRIECLALDVQTQILGFALVAA